MTNFSTPVFEGSYTELANRWGRQVNKFNKNKEENGFNSIAGKKAVEEWMADVTKLAVEAKKKYPVQLGHLPLAERREGIANVANPVATWNKLIAGATTIELPSVPTVVVTSSLAEQIAAQQREAKAEENRKIALAAEEKKKANIAAAEEKKKANIDAEVAETERVRKELEANEQKRKNEEAKLTKEVEALQAKQLANEKRDKERALKEAENQRKNQQRRVQEQLEKQQAAQQAVQRAMNQQEREKANLERAQKEQELKNEEQKLKNEEEKVRRAAAQLAAVPGTNTNLIRARLGGSKNAPSNLSAKGKKLFNLFSRENTQAGIRKLYKTFALQTHPNKGGNSTEFKELGKVYEIVLKKLTNSKSSPNTQLRLNAPRNTQLRLNAPRNTRVANAKKASNNKENSNRANMNKYMDTAEGNGNGGMSNANVAATKNKYSGSRPNVTTVAPRNVKQNLKNRINATLGTRAANSVNKLKRNINAGMSEAAALQRLANLNKQTAYQK